MEAEIVNAVVSSPTVLALLTEAFVPLVTILILVGLYRIVHRFLPQMISVINESKEQTRLMREMLNNTHIKINAIEDMTEDNSKRLDAIEMTLKKVSEELTEIRIANTLNKKGSNNVE